AYPPGRGRRRGWRRAVVPLPPTSRGTPWLRCLLCRCIGGGSAPTRQGPRPPPNSTPTTTSSTRQIPDDLPREESAHPTLPP
ncbi:unnamed protein product, partial [Ectocarpus sp. 12 AP-2014]